MLLNKLLNNINDIREGDRRLQYLRLVRNVSESSLSDIHAYQGNQLKSLIKHCYSNCEFYNTLYTEAGISPNDIQTINDIRKLPVITKEHIRQYSDKISCRNVFTDKMIRIATGGTTESPVPFIVDKESFAKRRAATLYFYSWFNYEIGDKIAYLWGAEQDMPVHMSYKQWLKRLLVENSICLPSSYLNNNIMYNYYRVLSKFKPKVLQAYPTPLYIFANFLKNNSLTLHIKNINVTAEYLYDHQREVIESTFDTKIFNWYGAREMGHIATECKLHAGLHINCSGLIVEVIKDGRQVINEEGDIVITDIFNRAMPLIRYRIGDIGILSDRICECGCSLPLLETVGGRYVDTFKKMDGTFVPGVSLTNRIIKQCRGIREMQIVQKDYKFFKLNIIKGEQYTENDLEDVKQNICCFMRDNLDFEINFVNTIPVERSGKVRFCKTEI